MVERKPFKTKLCVLYQKGHCPRQTCSFAHGEAELRRFSNSFNGRHDYRRNDLRDKLDRKRSPLRRYSPRRDGRGHKALRGYSPTRSLEKNSDRKRRKKELDDRSDLSGSEKISDGTEDRLNDRKRTSSNSRSALGEQLQQVQLDISLLDEHRHKLEVYLQERIQEADSLTAGIEELETQLFQERGECKRITSKIKKFLKAHDRHSHLQEELKRSHARLQKVGEQLGSDFMRLGDNEDSNINILSDGETTGNHTRSPQNLLHKNASPSKKRPRINMGTAVEVSKSVVEKEVTAVGTIGLEKRSRWDHNKKEVDAEDNGSNGHRTMAKESKGKIDRNIFANVPSADKYKGAEQVVLPSTGMAAHVEDEVIGTMEVEENVDVVGMDSNGAGKEAGNSFPRLPFLPPPIPPVPQNAYSQYKAEDRNVDVDGVEEESVDVDIV